MKSNSSPTIARRISLDEIRSTIRDRICLLEHEPGSLLHEAALATEFGVSRTPIREILQKLAQEGLVESRNGIGTLVKPLDFKEIEDIYEMRLRIAPLIGELAPKPVQSCHIARTEALLDRARNLARSFDLGEYWKINHVLHFVVGELIGNVALAGMWDRLYFQAARMWYDLARSLGPEVSRSLVREVEDTLEAMHSNDVAAIGFIKRTYIAYALRLLRARQAHSSDPAPAQR
ncbi:GntR family transcriptional regulator [Mesorhizobium sp. WSM3882]|uniref:GntR family transcriptional regulator n=1 Tax=Mesorhizobium sp. WSM3882 TaxID=2029407 RepID=UPI0015CC5D79|nr:GntR family transcriptional regulator [Mesorhizobium sp. WSM3882]